MQLEFRPAPAGTGIVFVRGDFDPPRRIPAAVAQRFEVPRRTNLARDGASVEMVEHVLAALAGLRIDNCEVWVDEPEMPGCDGSCWDFVEALQKAGAVQQDAPRACLEPRGVTRVGDDQGWVEARPGDTGGLEIVYILDYGQHSPIGRQTLEIQLTPATFCRELAPARTFLLHEEAQWLRQQGLGQRVSWQDLLVFDERGPIGNPLRYEDECVRHKALDLVGDLALLGCDLVGQVIAYRSGHRLNADLVAELLGGQRGHVRRRSA